MSSILKYLNKNKDRDFLDLKINEIDYVIFATLSYLNFEDLIIKLPCLELKTLQKSTNFKDCSKNYIAERKFKKFLNIVLNSKRYQKLIVTNFFNLTSLELETQFFGITFNLNNMKFITFRGTDRSYIGVKEDLDLAVKDVLPSQDLALKYVKNELEKSDQNEEIYIIGHSKGGNIAQYSYLFLSDFEKKKITKIVNLDGPGYRNKPNLAEPSDQKIIKFVPSGSRIGRLFDLRDNFSILKSSSISFASHDLLSWKVDLTCNSFITAKKFKFFGTVFTFTMDRFLKRTTRLNELVTIDFIYKLMQLEKSNDSKKFGKHFIIIFFKMFGLLKRLGKKKRKEIYNTGIKFVCSYIYCLFNVKKYAKTIGF